MRSKVAVKARPFCTHARKKVQHRAAKSKAEKNTGVENEERNRFQEAEMKYNPSHAQKKGKLLT